MGRVPVEPRCCVVCRALELLGDPQQRGVFAEQPPRHRNADWAKGQAGRAPNRSGTTGRAHGQGRLTRPPRTPARARTLRPSAGGTPRADPPATAYVAYADDCARPASPGRRDTNWAVKERDFSQTSPCTAVAPTSTTARARRRSSLSTGWAGAGSTGWRTSPTLPAGAAWSSSTRLASAAPSRRGPVTRSTVRRCRCGAVPRTGAEARGVPGALARWAGPPCVIRSWCGRS